MISDGNFSTSFADYRSTTQDHLVWSLIVSLCTAILHLTTTSAYPSSFIVCTSLTFIPALPSRHIPVPILDLNSPFRSPWRATKSKSFVQLFTRGTVNWTSKLTCVAKMFATTGQRARNAVLAIHAASVTAIPTKRVLKHPQTPAKSQSR